MVPLHVAEDITAMDTAIKAYDDGMFAEYAAVIFALMHPGITVETATFWVEPIESGKVLSLIVKFGAVSRALTVQLEGDTLLSIEIASIGFQLKGGERLTSEALRSFEDNSRFSNNDARFLESLLFP